MIIECGNCKRKFQVGENVIPQSGRLVQCGYCSSKWIQKPLSSEISISKPVLRKRSTITEDNILASDGKKYKFLGEQWAEILPSGKTGLLAKKLIAKELNKKTGKKILSKKLTKSKINPSKEIEKKNNKTKKETEDKKVSLDFFSYVFLIILIFVSVVGVVETFKDYISLYYPKIDNQLDFVYETFKNIIIIIKDIFRKY